MNPKNVAADEIYHRLTALTKEKNRWEEAIPFVGNCLTHPSDKIKEKSVWLIGEMGLKYPKAAEPFIGILAKHLQSENPKLRERAAGALGRIGRADDNLTASYLDDIFVLARDPVPNVRMNFIWACENIATNAPLLFENKMEIFRALLDDESSRVRIEAPEIFRVIGKRNPDFVRPYLPELERLADGDPHEVVRIHAKGAIRAAAKQTGRIPE